MSQFILPALFAIFLWWFSTGVILLADRLPKIGERGLIGAASLAGLLALGTLWWSANATTLIAAYASFTAGLVLWGWNEVAFLSGTITGPRRSQCPSDAKGGKRFVYAAQTLIYHEIAIALTAAVIAALLWGAANQAGLWAFGILWAMRLSTKFNIFLGVPNITEEFLPGRLAHLKSYFRTRALNLLFPVSITLGTGLTFWLAHLALGAATEGQLAAAATFTLLTTLAGLGVLEHWFLVLPLHDEELWRWYLRKPQPNPASTKSAIITESRAPVTAKPSTTTSPHDETPVRAGASSPTLLSHSSPVLTAGYTIGGTHS